MTARTGQGRGRGASRPRRWPIAVVLLVVLALAGGVVVVGRSVGVQPVTCTVVSAKPQASGGGRHSAPGASVYVTTVECGAVRIRDGVTRENMALVSTRVDDAATCTFDASWWDRTVKDWLGMTARGAVTCTTEDGARAVG
ncbi:hypothetical protein [Brachybacterium sp. NPDC056505]|uniref:hypothetical protein n=1 Tax=Brachybacterium sp. NPDC056505 TaxID=3345843 RepID=UPI003671B96E